MSESKEIKPAKVKDLPPKVDYLSFMNELTAAHSAVGELKGYLEALVNPDLLIAPFRKREAVASSAIEGTRATLEEVLKFEASDESKLTEEDEMTRKILDIREIRNYERAMSIALRELKTRAIGETLLRRTHNVLLDSVRGEHKDRGNFRKEQVRVGDYIPPVHTQIKDLISNWEKYLNTDTEKDVLVRIAVAHYQFEAIHPFMDGNGRIGRLVIPLFLCQEGILPTPVLYVSRYFEEHKVEYQTLLHRIDTHGEWEPWIKFFLKAVEIQAKRTTAMAKEIQDLYEHLKKNIITQIRSQHAITFLDAIFSQPYITASSLTQTLNAKSKGTTYNLIAKFIEHGVLREVKDGRESIYIFSDLLKIIRS